MARRESRLSILYPGERQDIEVFVSCRDLKILDRFRGISTSVHIYIERNGAFELADQTEKIKGNPNPDFKKSFNLEFFFAVRQNLKLVINDCSVEGQEKPVGEIFTSVGQILGNKNQTISFDIKKDGKKDAVLGRLVIRAERVNYTSDVAKMTIKARQLKVTKGLFSKPSIDFALRLYRYLGEAGFGLVYESEIRKTENPRWSEIQMKFQKLSNGDFDRTIKAQVVNYTSAGGTPVVLGEGTFTVNNLLGNQQLDFEVELKNPKTSQKTGTLVVDSFDLIEKPHFLDYLQAGLQFNVMIGIDYTSSNRDPFTPDSLHTLIDPNEFNEYQKAISGVCEILLNYDYDKKVLMFGFGGIPNFPKFKSELTSHCFPLTGDMFNPWAEQMEGIMKVYRSSFQNIQLASPTYFEPIFRQAMQIAKRNLENDSNEYTILLLLTDGKCHDMQDTINAIIESANLPLSVIIVGVGTDDFKKMEILDGDEGLANFRGQQAVRDLVQFVPFRDFENNPDLLAKNVLAEIPSQVVAYMQAQGIKPKALHQLPPQMEESRKSFRSMVSGLVGEDMGEEYKEDQFHNTDEMIEVRSQHFSKALEFMKKENNTSFVTFVRDNNKKTTTNNTNNNIVTNNVLNTVLRSSNTSSFAKLSNPNSPDNEDE